MANTLLKPLLQLYTCHAARLKRLLQLQKHQHQLRSNRIYPLKPAIADNSMAGFLFGEI
jgi:hypothetical protein